MKVIEKADVALIEPLLGSIEAGTAIIGRSKRFILTRSPVANCRR